MALSGLLCQDEERACGHHADARAAACSVDALPISSIHGVFVASADKITEGVI